VVVDQEYANGHRPSPEVAMAACSPPPPCAGISRARVGV